MPDIADTLLAAIRQHRASRHAEAEALYRHVLAAEPDQSQALYLYGLLLLDTSRWPAAVAMLRRAAGARPTHAGVLANLSRALLADEQPAEALINADRLLALDPDHAEAAFLRGTALNALGQARLAATAFEQAITRDPANAAAFLNLGNACADIDRLDLAERNCRQSIALAPDLPEAHASLGFILASLGRLPEAIDACHAAIARRPDFAQAHWNLAVAALLAGDFALGFREYEWRKRHDRFRHDFVDLPGPQWDGAEPDGRTILVHAEQGFGDTIQFARYLPLIADRGGRPVLACERTLIPLLASMQDVVVVPKETALPPYECWIDQMSLPRAFATQVDTIPTADGYLQADPVRIARWQAALPTGPRVGLAWAGNPAHSNDRHRSMPISELGCILAVSGINFISLQVGRCCAESPLVDLSPQLADFADTAALIAALDLVVTVDTAVAHIAGALGKPTWVMLPYAPDWRWQLGRDDTPWYSSLRLFRQREIGDWGGVTNAVAASLTKWKETRRA